MRITWLAVVVLAVIVAILGPRFESRFPTPSRTGALVSAGDPIPVCPAWNCH